MIVAMVVAVMIVVVAVRVVVTVPLFMAVVMGMLADGRDHSCRATCYSGKGQRSCPNPRRGNGMVSGRHAVVRRPRSVVMACLLYTSRCV